MDAITEVNTLAIWQAGHAIQGMERQNDGEKIRPLGISSFKKNMKKNSTKLQYQPHIK